MRLPRNAGMTAGLFVLLFGLAGASATSRKSHAVSELQAVPAGITLPVQFGRTLRAGKTKPGTVVVIKTTQRVPVTEDTYLDRGAKVRGEVVASTPGDGTPAHPSVLTLRWTDLEYRGKTIPVATRAVAVANLMAVDNTFLPSTGGAD